MVELLDAAVSLTRESQYGQEIKYHIDVAKELFLKTSLFNEKARQYLSFAHRMMTGGKKYEKPEGLDEFVTPEELQEKSRKYCATLVNGALAALERGHEVEAATLLLELVLAIVTPASGEPNAIAFSRDASVHGYQFPVRIDRRLREEPRARISRSLQANGG